MRTWLRANRTLKYKVGDRVLFSFPPDSEPRDALVVRRDRSSIPYQVTFLIKQGKEVWLDMNWLCEHEIIRKNG